MVKQDRRIRRSAGQYAQPTACRAGAGEPLETARDLALPARGLQVPGVNLVIQGDGALSPGINSVVVEIMNQATLTPLLFYVDSHGHCAVSMSTSDGEGFKSARM